MGTLPEDALALAAVDFALRPSATFSDYNIVAARQRRIKTKWGLGQKYFCPRLPRKFTKILTDFSPKMVFTFYAGDSLR